MKKKADTIRIAYELGDVFTIKPVSDIHFGSSHCDIKALKKFLGEPDPKTYIIGLGDWLDSIITSDSKRYRKSGDGNDPASDDIIDNQIEALYKIMEPYKSQIIGIGIGNHEDAIVKHCGTNPMKRMAEKLGTLYLGYSFLIRLLFRTEAGGGRAVVIRGHHGHGGGSRTQGADLTKYARDSQYIEADIYLYGHVHRLQYDTVPRLSLRGETLIAKDKHILICGTFLKTYSDSTDVTYSEIKGYPPASIGGHDITIKPISSEWCDIAISTWRA